MAIRDGFLPEMELEFAATRRVLERVPEDKADWRPHAKSTPMGQLAQHVADIPGWSGAILAADHYDLAPPDGPPYTPPVWRSRRELLASFDEKVAAAMQTVKGLDDGAFHALWTLKKSGGTLMTMPRTAVLRSFILNHLIHHRAQLIVYLRMNDVPLPAIYGPTADEGGM